MAHPKNLSKSKLVAFRQCPKRFWLEIHHPELRQDSAATQASFAIGSNVGEVARKLYDPHGKGLLIDAQAIGYPAAFTQTQQALQARQPVFEAGFAACGALAFADVLLPVSDQGPPTWRMVEVKSSGSVKGYHRDDLAIQYFVAHNARASVDAAALAHIDTGWVYPGSGNYKGLLVEQDLTNEVSGRLGEVDAWIREAHTLAEQAAEPARRTGPHCHAPFECGFLSHCRTGEPAAKHPVEWLPCVQTKALKEFVAREDIIDMGQVPDKLLDRQQLRVKQATITGRVRFDVDAAMQDLEKHRLPALFLDFETVSFVVPIWAGTRPYQQIPFQFSLHILGIDGQLCHTAFLDLSGDDPSERFAQALVQACAPPGPIFVYNKRFEEKRIDELADRCPGLRTALRELLPRLVDLIPIANEHYYHPSQQGSWSIKRVLPAMASELRYDDLEGIQDGGAAMVAYQEAIAPGTLAERKTQIREQLLAYCRLDTFAMIRVWSILAGRTDLRHLPDET
jgi:hypothetical protein